MAAPEGQPGRGAGHHEPVVDVEDVVAEEEAHEARDGVVQRRRFIIGAFALVALTGALVAVVATSSGPSTRALEVPDRMAASFVVEPQDGTTTSYNGRLHRVVADGAAPTAGLSAQISFSRGDGTTQTITLSDSRAYYEVTRDSDGEAVDAGCLGADDLPPYADMDDAFAEAVRLDTDSEIASYSTGRCDNHDQDVYTITWAGQVYIFCSLEDSAALGLSEFVGEGFVADVFDLDTGDAVQDTPDFAPPTAVDGSELECPEIIAESTDANETPAATGRRLRSREGEFEHPWYLKVADETDREGRKLALREASGRKLSSDDTCLFIHGLGRDTAGPVLSHLDYWGNVHDRVSCGTTRFVQLDTVTNDWRSATLGNAVCDVAAGGHDNDVIHNTRVFTHSMGTNIFASALDSSRCSLGSDSHWFAVSGPNTGSKAADWAVSLCSPDANFILRDIAGKMGFCDSGSATDAVASLTTDQDYSAVSRAVSRYADGIMCGTKAYGLNTIYSAGLSAIDAFIDGWRGGGVDGVVESDSSCAVGAPAGASFSSGSASSNFFSPETNHIDTTCRNGDGWWGGDKRKPCRWYERHG